MTTNAIAKTSDPSLVRFVPYGSSDEIKLSIAIVLNTIAVPTKSGKLPTQRDALRFIGMCQARRLNPLEGDAFLIGYDGQNGPSFSLITAHQAFLKRAELHPEFDGMESGIVVITEERPEPLDVSGDFHTEDQTCVGGWARVHFKTRKIPTYRRIRLARFNTGRAEWAKDAPGMICKCAEADALRSSFPTMLAGLYLRDEVTLDVGPRKAGDADGQHLVRVISDAIEPADDQAAEDVSEADAGLAPAKKPTPKDALPESHQLRLAQEMRAAGIDFPMFVRWASEGGQVKDADSIPEWDAIPSADAERLLRALRGTRTRTQMIEQMTTFAEKRDA